MNYGMCIDRSFPSCYRILIISSMANLKFQRIAVLLSSLFLGFSIGTIFIFIRPNSLDQDYHLGIFFTAGFFLGAILTPRLISTLFGTTDRNVTKASYCFTAFLTAIFAIFADGAEFFMRFVFPSIVPLFILSRISLYLSYKK